MSIQFRLIEIMLAIERTGCLSKAAQELYISQPALTQYIQRAENELGYPLLIRDKRSCSLTPAGRILAERGKLFLRYREEMLRDMRKANEKIDNTVRFGMANGYTRTYLSPIVNELSITSPDVHLIPFEGYTLPMIEQVLTGKLDMILLPLPPKFSKLASHMFRRENILVAVNPDCEANKSAFREGKKNMIELASLKNVPYIGLKNAPLFTNFCDVFFREAGYEPNTIFNADNWNTCNDMVSADMGFTLLPDSVMADSKSDNCYYHIKSQYPNYRLMTISYSLDRQLSIAEEQIIECVERIFGDSLIETTVEELQYPFSAFS